MQTCTYSDWAPIFACHRWWLDREEARLVAVTHTHTHTQNSQILLHLFSGILNCPRTCVPTWPIRKGREGKHVLCVNAEEEDLHPFISQSASPPLSFFLLHPLPPARLIQSACGLFFYVSPCFFFLLSVKNINYPSSQKKQHRTHTKKTLRPATPTVWGRKKMKNHFLKWLLSVFFSSSL